MDFLGDQKRTWIVVITGQMSGFEERSTGLAGTRQWGWVMCKRSFLLLMSYVCDFLTLGVGGVVTIKSHEGMNT
ncbi:MAG: hypothetical protein ACRESF_08390, partial [Pseudomonas sp.]